MVTPVAEKKPRHVLEVRTFWIETDRANKSPARGARGGFESNNIITSYYNNYMNKS